MAKSRYINTKFWDDNYIVELDPVEKLLFLYLLTNPITNIAGIYEIPLRRIAFDTGIDNEMVKRIFTRFEKDKKVFYRHGWIIICNFPKHQNVKESPKIRAGIEAILEELPDKIKKSIDTLSIPYAYPLNYSNSNTNTNSNNTGENKFSQKSSSSFEKKKKKGVSSGDTEGVSSGDDKEEPLEKEPSCEDKSSQDCEEEDIVVEAIDEEGNSLEKKDTRRVNEKEKIFYLFDKKKQPWWYHKQEKEAALRLLDMKGYKQVAKAVNVVKQNKDDPFCPQVNRPFQLEKKWDDLLAYKKKL